MTDGSSGKSHRTLARLIILTFGIVCIALILYLAMREEFSRGGENVLANAAVSIK